MRNALVSLILFASLTVSNAGEVLARLELLRTLDGRLYRKVEVINVTTEYIVARWQGGLGSIRLDNLSDDDLQKIGLPSQAERRRAEELAREKREREERDRSERQRDFEEAQRAKGLVQYGGNWVTPDVKAKEEAVEREKAAIKQAEALVMMKSRKNPAFRVFQALDHGLLCAMGERGRYTGRIYYTGETFFLYGVNRKLIAEGGEYGDDLYWAGTYTYTTVQGINRTINSYALDKEMALRLVMAKLGLAHGGRRDAPRGSTNGADEGLPDGLKGAVAYGSGFIITDDGYVITNNHVVSGTRAVRVRTETAVLQAKLIASDPDNDIALLKVEGSFTPVAFSKRRSAAMGETVFTLGFPTPTIQGFSPKVTKGVISSLKGIKDDVRMYQIDAAVQPGNSGGPLADANGQVIGVVVARLSDAFAARATGALPQNVNYAVKKAYILALVDSHPEVAKKLMHAEDTTKVPFEQAVSKVLTSTVLVIAE